MENIEEYALLSPEALLERLDTVLSIRIGGKGWESSMTANFAQTLVEIQDSLYRVVSTVQYGDDNLKRLTADKRKQYELNFKISEGSTRVESDFKETLVRFGRDMLQDMPPKIRSATLVALTTLLVGGALGYGYLEYLKQVASEGYQTERLYNAVDRLAQSQERITSAILKGARGADFVQIGRRSYSREDISEANRRAERVPYGAELVSDGNFTAVLSDIGD
ncbi:TPA: hypothetical protein ACLA2Z_000001 [Neisseria meningitidis]